jgi:hypothetical protein
MQGNYSWASHYLAAILETDDGRLPARIAAARAVLGVRLNRLADIHGNWEERRAIGEALEKLRVLREERIQRRGQVQGLTEVA